MEWEFNLQNGLNSLTLKAEVIYASYQIEHIKVKGNGISIVLQGNRPLLEAIGLKRQINWKLIEGNIKDEHALNRITTEVENYLKHHEIPFTRVGKR